jgi:hypothetical protein
VQAKAHRKHLNKSSAIRQDDDMHFKDRPAVKGTSGWKQWKSVTFLRCTFERIADGPRALSRIWGRASTTTIAQVRCFVAGVAKKLMRAKLQTLSVQGMVSPHHHSVLNVMFDETKATSKVDGFITVNNVLASHGLLQWSETLGVKHHEEIVVEPRLVEECTAECYFAAFDLNFANAMDLLWVIYCVWLCVCLWVCVCV